ncbi:protein of unknown function [Geodermatophilus pulveris]|uniref:DUF4440 domain-containing protein n=1 Tax=Geodermatophilus pulveris TaxID=1564159 RepID=A0A239FRW6_9ACTN|nr:protein of unknown function [Geodermatophilus pulveris]
MDADGRQVIEQELALLDPEVRGDADRVRSYLHPDFVEYGASGRVWDRASITSVTSGTTGVITAADVQVRRLGPGAVLVTYRSQASDRRALRGSGLSPRARTGLALAVPPGDALRVNPRARVRPAPVPAPGGQALKTWSEEHVEAMATARERHDCGSGGTAPGHTRRPTGHPRW